MTRIYRLRYRLLSDGYAGIDKIDYFEEADKRFLDREVRRLKTDARYELLGVDYGYVKWTGAR